MKNNLSRHKPGKPQTLKLTGVIGIKTDKKDTPVMSLAACIIVSVTALCLMKIYINSFELFGSNSAEPIMFSFTDREVRLFYSCALLGSLLVCGIHCVKRYYAATIGGLALTAGIVFVPRYKLISNGFIRAANRVMYTLLTSEGNSPRRYYLVYFDSQNPKTELVWFMAAAVFAAAVVLAFLGVRRCSAFWYSAVVMSMCSVPVALSVLEGEPWFVAAFVTCVLMYTISVSEYRRGGKRDIIMHFGRSIRVSGRFSAYAALEQTAITLICAGIISSVLYAAYDISDYKRNSDIEQLGRDIIHNAEYAASGTIFEQLGLGTSDNLNHGQVSKLGDLHYTGETMFEIKSERADPHYLCGYTADVFNGKNWKRLPSSTLRSFSRWNEFESDGFYPQFIQPKSVTFYDGSNYYGDLFHSLHTYDIEIVNKAINPRIFLTESYMLPEYSDEIQSGAAKARYDGIFSFSRRSSVEGYKERVLDPAFDRPAPYVGTFGSWTADEVSDTQVTDGEFMTFFGAGRNYVFDGNTKECLYEILHDGDFSISVYAEDDSPQSSDLERFSENEKAYRQYVLENYLDFPDNMDSYLPDEFDEAIEYIFKSNAQYIGEDHGIFYFDNYYESVESTVRQYLSDNAEYTLSPGQTPRDRDFLEYFLNENHKGYCVHFATAAAVMLRRAGIPTRYCEGYIAAKPDLSPKNAVNGGYHPIPDSNAHAWVEVYYPLLGWQPVEFTPPYINSGSSADDRSSGENSDSDTDTQSDKDPESDTETDTAADSENSSDTDSESSSDTDSEEVADSDISSENENTPARPGGSASSPPSKLWKTLKSIISKLLKLLIIAAAAVLLRTLVIKLRLLYFTKGAPRRRAAAMYCYSLWLLRLQGIKKGKLEGAESFSVKAGKSIRGVSSEQYKGFTAAALKASFGRDAPTEEELDKMYKTIKHLSKAAYDSLRKPLRALVKYGLFLE